MPAKTKVTTDHNEIRRWAQRHGGFPAVQKKLGSPHRLPHIEIFFDRNRNTEKRETTWDNFLDIFDQHNYAFMYEEGGRFHKFVDKQDLERARHPELRMPQKPAGRRSMRIAARLDDTAAEPKKSNSRADKKTVRVSTQGKESRRKIRRAA